MSGQMILAFIILQVATIVAIVLFLRMLLHKQLQVGIKRIKKLNEENLKKEAQLNTRFQQLDKECNMKLEEASKKAKAMQDRAEEETRKMRDEQRIKAKEESKRIIASGLQEKEKVMKELHQEVFERAVKLSQDILRRIFSEEDLQALRNKASKEVIDFLVDSRQVEELVQKNKSLEVVTADPLTKANQDYIFKIVHSKEKGGVDIKFTVDKNVLGGLVLKIGKQIIDGSIAYRINKAALEIKQENIL